ncbi:DASH complex subunit dad4 [Rhodotorula diobovata]|uniref:DASH complex subunit DAD4 n=1 Tax=Rhodotorula diobovata TaxID=5288 RepID=A0A5C5G0Z7_9BASI|nr:DASH complex subunit dad4 [Rhodotorula diobovata]
MNNPYEEEQEVIIARILGTVGKLNESMQLLNDQVAQVNAFNLSTSEVAELWASYMRNVQWNLQSQKTLHPPV